MNNLGEVIMTDVTTVSSAVKIEPKAIVNYNHLMEEVSKPFSERKELDIGRGGDLVKPRKYHLTADEKAEIIALCTARGAKVVNPYELRIGVTWAEVEALIHLGINEYHSLKSVRNEMQAIMSAIPKEKDGKVSTLWDEFYNRRGREGAALPKDGEGKIVQNFLVLQRLAHADRTEKNPYGKKLAQFNMSIDIEYKQLDPSVEPIPFFCLNTLWSDEDSVIPKLINPNPRKGGRKKKVVAE